MDGQIFMQGLLPIAVAKWQDRIRLHWDAYYARREEFVELIASGADEIIYLSNTPGETARRFNEMACAVALCSFMPGGIHFCGMHFEAHR